MIIYSDLKLKFLNWKCFKYEITFIAWLYYISFFIIIKLVLTAQPQFYTLKFMDNFILVTQVRIFIFYMKNLSITLDLFQLNTMYWWYIKMVVMAISYSYRLLVNNKFFF